MPCGCFFLNRTLLSDPAVCLAGSVVQVAHQGLRCVAGTNGGDAVYCSPKWGSCERSIARDVAAPVARCVNYAMTFDYNAGLAQRVIYEPPANAAEREDFDPEDWTSRQWVSWHPALLNNGSTDDCGSEALIFTTPGFPNHPESDCPPLPGLVNVTLVVADRAGRTSRCVAAVNVITAINLPKKGTMTFAVVNEPLTLGKFGGAGQAELACRKDIKVSISPDKISCANVNRVTLVSIRISGGAAHDSVHEVFVSDPSGVCGKATTVCPASSTPPCAPGLHGTMTPDGTFFCFDITPTNTCRLVSSSSPILALPDAEEFSCVDAPPRPPNRLMFFPDTAEFSRKAAIRDHFRPLTDAARALFISNCYRQWLQLNRTGGVSTPYEMWFPNSCPEHRAWSDLLDQEREAVNDVERSCFGGFTRLDCFLFNVCPLFESHPEPQCHMRCNNAPLLYRNKCGAYCSCAGQCEECPAVCDRVDCPFFCAANRLPKGAPAVVGVAAPDCQVLRDASGAVVSIDYLARVPRTIFQNVTGPPTLELLYNVSYRACVSLRVASNAWSFPSQMALVKATEGDKTCEGANFAVADATLAPAAPAADVATTSSFVSVNAMLGIALALLFFLTCVIMVVLLRLLASVKALKNGLNQCAPSAPAPASSPSTRQSRRRSRRMEL